MNLPTTVYAVDQTTLVALLIRAGVYATQEANLAVNPGFGCHFNPPIPDSGWVSAAIFAPTDEAYAIIKEVFANNINIANMPVEARFLGQAAPGDDSVTTRQLQLEMAATPFYDTTLLKAVEAAVAASPDDIQIWWRTSQRIQRNHELVAAMLPVLGVSAEMADKLFARAKTRPE